MDRTGAGGEERPHIKDELPAAAAAAAATTKTKQQK